MQSTEGKFDWSRGKEILPVECTNELDDQPYPSLVEYCTEVFVPSEYQERIYEASKDIPYCGCIGSCQPSSCKCRLAYNDEGLLLDVAQPVLECHSKCQCNRECANRQVSRGVQYKLALMKTPHKGWGVITCSSIRSGAFIVEYTGELISTQETQRRFTDYDAHSVNYLLVLREWRFLRTNIDATRCGNISRFMNHNCAPNCVLVPVRIGTVVPRAALFALRNINPGEELCFDYGTADAQVTGVKCQCEAPNCRGWLPRDSSV